MKASLPHQCKKPHCLKRYGLTAGVRSGHDEQCEIFSQRHSDRNHFFLVKKWVTAFTDVDPSFCIEDRAAGAHGKRQSSAGKDKVEICHGPVVGADLLDVLRRVFAQTGEDYLDFFLLFGVKFLQVIVQFHDCHGFDKQSGASGRLIVDQSLYL